MPKPMSPKDLMAKAKTAVKKTTLPNNQPPKPKPYGLTIKAGDTVTITDTGKGSFSYSVKQDDFKDFADEVYEWASSGTFSVSGESLSPYGNQQKLFAVLTDIVDEGYGKEDIARWVLKFFGEDV